MKVLHRPDVFSWSQFNRDRNIDFHGHFWKRDHGNVAIDPLPVDEHDAAQISALGGVSWILISNADHTRAAAEFKTRWGAKILGPKGDSGYAEFAGIPVDGWMEADEVLPCGIRCLGMGGSKTPGELAFLLPPGDTLVCGDLIRAHQGGSLNLLPDGKLKDRARAIATVRRLADLPGILSVLVGDGWPVFRDGSRVLGELAERLSG